MRTRTTLAMIPALAAAAAAGLLLAGPLTPPAGPVAPTNKTLVEVEPRVALSAANTPGDANSVFRITQPGSYYLTDNLTILNGGFSGVEIAASNVTLDLHGFAITGGTRDAADGITLDTSAARNNITIRNGSVSVPGVGLNLGAGGGSGCLIESVMASDCGSDGFRPPDKAVLRRCTAMRNASGFLLRAGSVIEESVAGNNSLAGISAAAGCAISGCTVTGNGGHGIDAGGGCSISRCAATGNTGAGIHTSDTGLNDGGSTIADCTAGSNGGDGIASTLACTIAHCSTRRNSGMGIRTTFGSTVTGCSSGFDTGGGMTGNTGTTFESCTVFNSAAVGITLGDNGAVLNCTTRANSRSGISAGTNCEIRGNTCLGNGPTPSGGSGVLVSGSSNQVQGNTCVGNANYGIEVTSTVNLIYGNSCRTNSLGNFSILTGNRVGTIVVPPLSGTVLGSSGAAGFGSTDPWANFAY